ncbi:peptidase S9 [Catenovulum maritimum]|uniref:Peptidase S9 n=1 Tax=Catenovulum maritimum TaxID=1513271 RepID=A0A0J8GZF7_9ALTE|nr:peptidase S9 [Catenovulum maritimum]
MKNLTAILLIVLCTFTNLAISKPQFIPTKAFASKPDVSKILLSPDGKHIAMLLKAEQGDVKATVLQSVNLQNFESSFLTYAENKKYVMTDIAWLDNENIIVDVKYPASRRGTPVDEYRVVKINIFEKKLKSVIPKSTLSRLDYVPNVLSNVLSIVPEDPNYIIMQISGHMHTGEPSVVQIPLTDKARTRFLERAETNIFHWKLDQQRNVRIGIYRDKTHYKILERKNKDEEFRTLWKFEAFSAETVWPLGFDLDPNILYVQALHKGKDAIYKVDLTDKDLKLNLVYAKEDYDVSGYLTRSNKTGEVIGAGGYIWDKARVRFEKAIDKALPDNDNYLVSFSQDENKYITLSTSDTEAGVYLVGDRKAKTMDIVAYRYSDLKPELMAAKEKISYKARDGLTIEGYLTLPQASSGKNLPTLIFPHGGPISYDNDGFDYWTQFFANRGYAVLQMNFRGSAGYGFQFMQQGLRAWGQAMQDDVEDGTKWIIEQGVANPDKVCIVGASYGGYAALMGTVKTPDLYKCAVSFAGVSDIEALVKAHRNFVNYEIVKKQIGDDYSKLWEHSPLKHAEKIKVPVLLIHGTKDRVVRVDQSEDMFDELDDLDKDVEYIELDGGDHYLSNADHRLTTFKAMEKFLAKQLL